MTRNYLFVTTSLLTGGAETALVDWCRELQRRGHRCTVLALRGRVGPPAARLEELGIPYTALGLERPWVGAPRLLRFLGGLGKDHPTHLQGWMYHANCVATFLWLALGRRPMLGHSIHSTLYSLSDERPATRVFIRLGARLSRLAGYVLYCSEASRRNHEALGYRRERSRLVPNGFDLTAFGPDPESRASVRRELGIAENATVIGQIARFHPLKGVPDFISAMPMIRAERPDVEVVLAGLGMTADSPEFRRGDLPRLHLLGERQDVARILQGLDVLVNPSRSESFPMVIGEAMASGVPCVVTDVGECRAVVADTGLVVPPADPPALARGVLDMLSLSPERRTSLGTRARDRIRAQYSLESVMDSFLSL